MRKAKLTATFTRSRVVSCDDDANDDEGSQTADDHLVP